MECVRIRKEREREKGRQIEKGRQRKNRKEKENQQDPNKSKSRIRIKRMGNQQYLLVGEGEGIGGSIKRTVSAATVLASPCAIYISYYIPANLLLSVFLDLLAHHSLASLAEHVPCYSIYVCCVGW